MNKEMHDLASWAVETAKKAGASDCRVAINQHRSVDISYRDRKPENIKESSTRGLGIDFFVEDRFSSQNTSDLRKPALEEFLAGGVAATRLLAEDLDRTLPDPRYYAGRAAVDLKLDDPGHGGFSPQDRHRIAQAVENSCLETGGDRTISATARIIDGRSEGLMMTSNGFEGYSSRTSYSISASMTAQDEGDRRPMGGFWASAVDLRDLPEPQEVGRLAARDALAQLGARKLATETLPVIIQNRNVGRLLAGLFSALNGSNIHRKRSFLHDRMDSRIASQQLSIIDDPHIEKSPGSRLFDSEGLASRKRTIIDEGVLRDFYVDWYYSRKLGREPTSGSSSNLVIPPGQRSVTEIMKDLGRGLLITGFIGGNSNPTTGDASIGIIGRLFENGEPTQPVAEMNIADNHLRLWNRLAEVADDPWAYSSWRLPSVVISDVVVAGV